MQIFSLEKNGKLIAFLCNSRKPGGICPCRDSRIRRMFFQSHHRKWVWRYVFLQACCCFDDKSVPLDFAACLKYSLLQSNTLRATTARPWGWVCEIFPSAYRSSTINRSSWESPGYSIKRITFLSWHTLSAAFAYMAIQLHLH